MRRLLMLQLGLLVIGLGIFLVGIKQFILFGNKPIGDISFKAPQTLHVQYNRQIFDEYLQKTGYWKEISWAGKIKDAVIPLALIIEITDQNEEEWFKVSTHDKIYSSYGFYVGDGGENTIKLYLSSTALNEFKAKAYQSSLGGMVLTGVCLESNAVANISLPEDKRLNLCGADAFAFLKNKQFMKLSNKTSSNNFFHFDLIKPVFAVSDYCSGNGAQYCGDPVYDCACSSDSSVCTGPGSSCGPLGSGGTCNCTLSTACSYSKVTVCGSLSKQACGVNDCAHPECYVSGGCSWVYPPTSTPAPTNTPVPGVPTPTVGPNTPVPTQPQGSCSGWCTNAGDTCASKGLPGASGTCSNGGECCGNPPPVGCSGPCCNTPVPSWVQINCNLANNSIDLSWNASDSCPTSRYFPELREYYTDQLIFSAPYTNGGSITASNLNMGLSYYFKVGKESNGYGRGSTTYANPQAAGTADREARFWRFSCNDSLGTVKDSLGSPMAGAQLNFTNGSGQTIPLTTDSNGHYYTPYGLYNRHYQTNPSYVDQQYTHGNNTIYTITPLNTSFITTTYPLVASTYTNQDTNYWYGQTANCGYDRSLSPFILQSKKCDGDAYKYCNDSYSIGDYSSCCFTTQSDPHGGNNPMLGRCDFQAIAPTPTPTPTNTPTPTPTPTTAPGPWIKIKDSSFISANTDALANNIPNLPALYDATDDTTEPYFIIGNAGLVAKNPLINITTVNPNAKFSNPNPPYSANYSATFTSTYLLTSNTYLSYVKARKQHTVITNPNLSEITGSGIYIYQGNLTLTNTNLALANATKFVLIVDGDVTIDQDKFNSNDCISAVKSIAILSKTGSISFSDTTQCAAGIFIANDITTGVTSILDNRGLKIIGNLVDQDLTSPFFSNDRKWANQNRPSLFIKFDPTQYIDLLPYLSTASYQWSQIQ